MHTYIQYGSITSDTVWYCQLLLLLLLLLDATRCVAG
jgi:hypothetical protein